MATVQKSCGDYGLLRPGAPTYLCGVPRSEVPARLREADVVLLPHSFEYAEAARDEFRTIFPTKTIEYLISGRPMLAHAPADAFLTQFLQANEVRAGRRSALTCKRSAKRDRAAAERRRA